MSAILFYPYSWAASEANGSEAPDTPLITYEDEVAVQELVKAVCSTQSLCCICLIYILYVIYMSWYVL